MATTSAQYQVLSDGSFTLARGDEYRLLFNPENNAYLEDTDQRAAILMYSVDPSEDAGAIELEVFARMKTGQTKRISVLRVSGGHLRTVTEPFNPAELSLTDNRLSFRISQGVGSVRISNVIMWYHRRI